ncbi:MULTISPECIES: acyltransferase [unclassified Providencia]|uniref:acyltransferase n=1 Tax=unclassified Providencia TaxID=2633465 RepID=UPI00234AEAEF|nr:MULTISPECIES: acyltransferase [unclassified Providencia]
MYTISYYFTRLKASIFKIFHLGLFKGVILFDYPRVIHSNDLIIGKETRINSNVFINAEGKVIIGENVTLSHGATILSTGYDLNNWKSNQLEKKHISKPIIIEDNVWIGANVTVLSGVKIAKGVVIAAGSVVTKNLECSNALYAGIPARKIKDL